MFTFWEGLAEAIPAHVEEQALHFPLLRGQTTHRTLCSASHVDTRVDRDVTMHLINVTQGMMGSLQNDQDRNKTESPINDSTCNNYSRLSYKEQLNSQIQPQPHLVVECFSFISFIGACNFLPVHVMTSGFVLALSKAFRNHLQYLRSNIPPR